MCVWGCGECIGHILPRRVHFSVVILQWRILFNLYYINLCIFKISVWWTLWHLFTCLFMFVYHCLYCRIFHMFLFILQLSEILCISYAILKCITLYMLTISDILYHYCLFMLYSSVVFKCYINKYGIPLLDIRDGVINRCV